MRLSADSILFGLDILRQTDMMPTELAAYLRDAARFTPAGQLAVLQEKIIRNRRDLTADVERHAAPPYAPMSCAACRRVFRARIGDASAESDCPVCGEPMRPRAEVLLLRRPEEPKRRAAEAEPVYGADSMGRIGHFEVLALIGKGGAGKVYRVRNVRSDRISALKVLDFQPLEPVAETFARLRKESQAAARVSHPNIVRVLDMGVAEGLPFVEMELVQGGSLRRRVQSEGALPAEEACEIVLGALAGLAAVHAADIVHGDIKPGNVLLEMGVRPRLADFGVARFLEETTSLMSASHTIGSPHFMAPEQWRGDPLTPRTDLYAMGLVLYYALTGQPPYADARGPALMYRHLHEPLVSEAALSRRIPKDIADVIRRASRKMESERFRSAEEFADALERACGSL